MRDISPHAVAHMIIGNIHGYLVHQYLYGNTDECGDPAMHDSKIAAKFLTTILFDGLQRPTMAPVDS